MRKKVNVVRIVVCSKKSNCIIKCSNNRIRLQDWSGNTMGKKLYITVRINMSRETFCNVQRIKS